MLTGEVSVRRPAGIVALVAGAVMCFPAGPSGAHQVSNTHGEVPARVLMFSRDGDPVVCVYPDSDKLAVFNRAVKEDELMVRRSDPGSHLDYFDGEVMG